MPSGKTGLKMYPRLTLTDEQLDQIESLAACNYSPADIAKFLGEDIAEFRKEFARGYDESFPNEILQGNIAYRYEAGRLKAKAEIDIKLLSNAKSGNLTAAQIYVKNAQEREFENIKMKILYGEV